MITVAIDIRRINSFGFGTYIRNVIRSLARLDHENRYLLIGRPETLEQLNHLPANIHLVPCYIPEASPLNMVGLWRLLRHHRVDVLHVPHYKWIPPSLPCPYVVTVHDLVDYVIPQRHRRSRLMSRLLFAAVRHSLHRAARIIAVSQATRRDIIRLFNVPGEKVQVVYNAIDERFLAGHASEEEKQMIAARYAIHYPFILYTGDVRAHKNVEKLIEAFAALKVELGRSGEYPNLKLIIIGDEISRYPHLRRTVIRSRIENDVRFLGFVPIEALRVFYDMAKVFAFPSRYEGFGMPPLEAMAHGTPVVASNTSSLPEVLEQAALTVNPENVFEIMRGLRQCLIDRATRDLLKERGYQQVRQYSWERSAEQILTIYQEVAAHSLALQRSQG